MMEPEYELKGLNIPGRIRTRTIDELYQLHKEGRITLPSFQRKFGVWKQKAQQKIITDIIERNPLPQVIANNTGNGKPTLDIIDGQQRLFYVFDFIDNKFEIKKSYDSIIGGKKFIDLTKTMQKQFRQYEIVMMEFDTDNKSILREYYISLDTLGTSLNASEVRTARYEDSEFNYAVIKYTKNLIKFYTENNVMKGNMIMRSLDKELTAEFLVLAIYGPQSSGKTLDSYYRKNSKDFREGPTAFKKVKAAVDDIQTVFRKDILSKNPFNSFANIYALVGSFIKISEMGYAIKDPQKISRDLEEFMSKVKSVGKKIKEADIVTAKTLETSKEGQYWKTLQEATRSKRNRDLRIRALSQIIIPGCQTQP